MDNGKGKSKIHPMACPKGTEGVDVDLYPFFNLGIPAALLTGKNAVVHFIGD